MDLVYYDIYQNKKLEEYVTDYGNFLKAKGERPVTVTRCATVEDVLKRADVVSLHTVRRGAGWGRHQRLGWLRPPSEHAGLPDALTLHGPPSETVCRTWTPRPST